MDQSSLCQDPLNFAYNEPTNPYYNGGVPDSVGINRHPGDHGMQAIADSLYGAWLPTPTQPPSLDQ